MNVQRISPNVAQIWNVLIYLAVMNASKQRKILWSRISNNFSFSNSTPTYQIHFQTKKTGTRKYHLRHKARISPVLRDTNNSLAIVLVSIHQNSLPFSKPPMMTKSCFWIKNNVFRHIIIARHIDIDECSVDKNACDSYQNCVNTPGSFRCECKSGFSMDKVLNACVGELAIIWFSVENK